MQSEIEAELKAVTDLISLPEIYLKIRELMDDEHSDIYDFAEVIQVDPNLSVRILRLVNSAYFGFPQPVTSIAQSVNLIGIGQLHNMVLGISAIASLNLPNDSIDLGTFWRSSLYAGVLARLLAMRLKIANSDQLFIAGLLHEIGHLVLYSKFPLQALAARNMALEQGKEIHQAELSLMGCHYGDIGARLMANWNLPDRLQNLTKNHPQPTDSIENQDETLLMYIAHICGQIKTSESPQLADNEIDAELLTQIGLSMEDLETATNEADIVSADMAKVIFA